jgi:glycosyltransferase involved in cell wall biosynthesis
MIDQNQTIPVFNKGVTAKQCGTLILRSQTWTVVPLDFLTQFGFDRDLVFDYSEFKEQMATRDELGRFTFDWWCPLSMVDGYGRHALSLFKGFQLLNTNPILHNDGWGVDFLYVPGDVEIARAVGSQKLPSKVGAMMTLPYHVYDTQTISKVIITQFETDHIPEKHVANVNKCDHLIVTSSFQPKIWKNSGCKIPISVMTPGIDTDFFTYKERPKDGKFKVLILGALTGRKNVEGAIRIFQAASEGNPDWRLSIKTRKTHEVPRIEAIASRDKRIEVIVHDSHPDHVLWYYHQNDVLLWPSKGEGCGLPPLEAMSTGMEVVCSDNSGMQDFVDEDHCWPIKTERMEPANIPGMGFSPEYTYQFGSVGNWWCPDEKHGVEQLKRCFNSWYEGKGKGLRAAEYVRKHHTLKIQAASVLKVLMQYE